MSHSLRFKFNSKVKIYNMKFNRGQFNKQINLTLSIKHKECFLTNKNVPSVFSFSTLIK